jgi:hypothetical protein
LVKALMIRHYFAPALANFKLVQERLRQRAELLNAGTNLPLSAVRIPSAILAGGDVAPPLQEDRPAAGQQDGTPSKVLEDRP